MAQKKVKSPHRLQKIKQLKRIRKWKKRSLVCLLALIFIIVASFILIYTSLGAKAITSIVEKTVPGIHFGQVEGALNDLTIRQFSLEQDGIEIKIDKIDVAISGLCLIKGQICIKDLNVNQTLINIATDKLSSTPAESDPVISNERFIIDLPLPLELRNAHLTDVTVNVDDMTFGLSSFTANASWINETIYVYSATAMDVKALFSDQPDTASVANAVVNTKSNTKSNTTAKTEPTPPINEIINGIFNQPLIAALPEVNIPLDFDVRSLTGSNWLLHIGGEDYQFDNVVIQANTKNNQITAKRVETDAKTIYGDAHAIVTGNILLGRDWPLNGTVALKTIPKMLMQSTAQIATEVTGKFAGQLLGELSSEVKITGYNQADLKAKVDFKQKYMPISVLLSGRYLQWPITGKPLYQLNDFSLDLSGSVQQYHLNTKGQFSGEDLPTILFATISNGTNNGIAIDELSATFPQGKFDLSGTIAWQNELKWNTRVNLDHIDLSKDFAEYPIKLNGTLTTDGIFNDQYWLVNLREIQVIGEINQHTIYANGELSVNANQFISANHFSLRFGDNKVNINGSSQQANLIAELDLAKLEQLYPGLFGTIQGQFLIKGTVVRPEVESDLNFKQIAWQDFYLRQAQLTGHIAYKDRMEGEIDIDIEQLDLDGPYINKAKVTLTGNELNHVLTITNEGSPISLVTTLTGHLNAARDKWNGSLSESLVKFGEKTQWKLDNLVLLTYEFNTQKASISQHCWVNNGGKVCLEQDVVITDKATATVTLTNIDLSLFDLLSDGETKVAGRLQGKIDVDWDKTKTIPTIIVNIYSEDVYVEQAIASQTLPIPFDLFSIRANINEQMAQFAWKFSLKEFGIFNGDIRVTEPTGRKQLAGTILIDHLSLSLINPLLLDNEHASGVINANLVLSGTLQDPYLRGNLDLAHSEIKASQLPIDMRSITLNIDFNGKSSVLKGQMNTEAGVVNINGEANWQNLNNWTASTRIKGDAIVLTVPPMAVVSIIPDISISATQDLIDIKGRINIPKATIKVDALPASSVNVSDDEVLLDNNLQEIKPKQPPIAINSSVFVSLGDNISFDAFGLTAKLTGGVYVNQNSKGLSVNGQITIPSGRFHAYGQDLIVKKGEIIFAGPPEQPRLNIEAIRNPESIINNVVAGIRVTGLAEDPKVEIFSEPPMSQQEALSYLLRGQGLESGEQSDNDMMTALLIGFGTAQGGKFIGDIGDVFGIRNLSVDTQGVGDGQQVVVSGYLLPNLQLKYGIGIFDSLATFTLRYRLLPRLYLEATSGIAQTVDLLYQFEF